MAGRDGFETLMRAEYARVLRLVTVVLGDESAARDVYLAAEAAYERYPEEADSRVVGDAVAKAALREAKAARAPAKAP